MPQGVSEYFKRGWDFMRRFRGFEEELWIGFNRFQEIIGRFRGVSEDCRREYVCIITHYDDPF